MWESDAENVSLGAGLTLPLWRVEGTDVWVLRARIRGLDQAIVSLGFLGTFGGTTRYIGGDGCWRGDLAPPAPPVSRPLLGSVVEASLPGPTATERRTVTVYRPPGHRPGFEHPAVYIADGHMTEALASVLEPAIVEGQVPPTVLVGVASSRLDGRLERANEYLAGRAPERFEAHRAFFVEAVGRWAEEEHGAATNRRHRLIFGVSAGATFAASMAVCHPDRFGTVLAFSMGWMPADFALWPRGDVPRHYLAAGTLEDGFRAATAGLAVAVTRAGGECVHVEPVSGHDYRMWEGQFVEAVTWALS